MSITSSYPQDPSTLPLTIELTKMPTGNERKKINGRLHCFFTQQLHLMGQVRQQEKLDFLPLVKKSNLFRPAKGTGRFRVGCNEEKQPSNRQKILQILDGNSNFRRKDCRPRRFDSFRPFFFHGSYPFCAGVGWGSSSKFHKFRLFQSLAISFPFLCSDLACSLGATQRPSPSI